MIGVAWDIQSGLLVEGLATTMPAAAPGASEPLEPMLLSTPWRAIGLSEAMKLVREPVSRACNRCGSAGWPRHTDAASKVVAANRLRDGKASILTERMSLSI